MNSLLRFRAQNFGSIADWVELSTVASLKSPGVIEVPRFRDGVLPAIGIYGANASGKSTVIGALNELRRSVILSHRSWDPTGDIRRNPHRFGDWPARATEFEIDFVVLDTRYQYAVSFDDKRIVSESLQAFVTSRPQVWFRRDYDEFSFPGNQLKGGTKVESITRPNSLFLSAGAQTDHPQLRTVANWFRRLTIVRSNSTTFRFSREGAIARQLRRDGAISETLSLLRFADLGITDLRPVKEVSDELDGQKFERDRILFTHNGVTDLDFDSRDESAGTLTWLDYVFFLSRVLPTGGQMVVDEIDRSLHPILSQELVKLFQDPEKNRSGAQLLFTAHDTSLMDPHLDWPLRRDQVWLTEKNRNGSTELSPLLDFDIRPRQNIEEWYRQGRFGAVPIIDDRDIDFVLEPQSTLFDDDFDS